MPQKVIASGQVTRYSSTGRNRKNEAGKYETVTMITISALCKMGEDNGFINVSMGNLTEEQAESLGVTKRGDLLKITVEKG